MTASLWSASDPTDAVVNPADRGWTMVAMPSDAFAARLEHLPDAELVALFRARPDLLIRPLPRGFDQLAHRLDSPQSLSRALAELDRDCLRVGMAAALLTVPPTPAHIAAFLGAPVDAVERVAADLVARGLGWLEPADGPDGTAGDRVVRLTGTLHAHWNAAFAGLRPAATLARNVVVADLRATVNALGADPADLRKPELVALLTERLSEPARVAAIIAELPRPAREFLRDLRDLASGQFIRPFFGGPAERRAEAAARQALVRSGLLLLVNNRAELPREVATAAWISEDGLGLSGPPDAPRPSAAPAVVASAAQAGAAEALRAVTALVDEAAAVPLAALKNGGIGVRERQRLTKRLSLPLDDLPLWIDLAATAGLLTRTDGGYGPGPRFAPWRDEPARRQWAALALAWYQLGHAPSARDSEPDEDRETPPPLPIDSEAGIIRRALLRAATGGRSARLAGTYIDWYAPLHGYAPAARDAIVAATIREAELLGVVAVDVLTGLGEALLAEAANVADLAVVSLEMALGVSATTLAEEIAAAAERLGDRCEPLLPTAPTSLILQSDLTALVSGQPTAAMSRLLRAAAVPESRGAAAVWRFTSVSVRTAMDAGWSADDLLADLRAAAHRPLPQALEYLIADVARRHGHVRVRGLRSAVLGDEPTLTEVLHTRILAKLHLARLAPTVLSSPEEPPTVLAELRRAGFYPMPEDATGTIILPAKDNTLGPPAAGATGKASRGQKTGGDAAAAVPSRRVTPAALIAHLRTAELAGIPELSPRASDLSRLNDRLAEAELTLLAEAIDSHTDIVITYRDKNGSRTIRRVQPGTMYGRWLVAYCHLRNDDREFTIANIETVAPAH
ncbi:Helicase XPB/Ssl2 N-terminal domain-containing protein [Frankia sp. AgKG'84/4]